jgi:hypothetical protein
VTKKIPNKRLNKDDRRWLKNFAATQIETPKETEAEEEAYQALLPEVVKAVLKRYPKADMDVMAKYDATTLTTQFYMNSWSSEFQFNLRDSDCNELQLRIPSGYGSWKVLMADKPLMDLFNTWLLASRAKRKAYDEKLRQYQTVIESCNTFNEIATIWPALEKHRTRFVPPAQVAPTALTILGAETINFIQNDNAGHAS